MNISYSSFYAYFIFSLIFSRFSNGEKMYTSAKKLALVKAHEVVVKLSQNDRLKAAFCARGSSHWRKMYKGNAAEDAGSVYLLKMRKHYLIELLMREKKMICIDHPCDRCVHQRENIDGWHTGLDLSHEYTKS